MPDPNAGARVVRSMPELVRHVAQEIKRRQVHPSRCVVLLPNPELAQHARSVWCAAGQPGFVPHFETALQCANRLGAIAPAAGDLSFDTALDMLGARPLLEAAGLGSRQELVAMLLERAHLLGRVAAAAGPMGRASWAAMARAGLVVDTEMESAALDSALTRIAIEWCAASVHATDVLFLDHPDCPWDMLVLLEGVNWDPLPSAVGRRWADRCLWLRWQAKISSSLPRIGAALDGEDEAELASAVTLEHLGAGRGPVALVANDRLLTRRVAAHLSLRGVALRDETGWKLSTTRVAAWLMAGLQACAWDASSDQVLEWLKASPAIPASKVRACELTLRQEGEPRWHAFMARQQASGSPLASWLAELEVLCQGMRGSRPLVAWLEDLERFLDACGLWHALLDDSAGEQLIQALRLNDYGREQLAGQPLARKPLSAADFVSWVDAVLEAGRFLPDAPESAQVVVLPLVGLMGREFDVVVMPGCDASHLSASPPPDGPWGARQRESLGLPSRAELEARQRQGWIHALTAGHCDLLWHGKEPDDRPVPPSPLLRALQFEGGYVALPDPRPWQELMVHSTDQPRPAAAMLRVTSLSASAYEDLRRCPYRFFALRQLGLSEREEIDQEPGKREFGTWLHEVLSRFHEALPQGLDQPSRRHLLDVAARQTTIDQHLDEALFLPFLAVWPNIRDAYLSWLDHRELQGLRFKSAELKIKRPLGDLELRGTIDRVDEKPDGGLVLLDYKTEREEKVRKRVADPGEDTQLAFYAALLEGEQPEACYLAIGERGEVKPIVQGRIHWARDALLKGVADDMRRIHAGAPMPALGEGASCEHCPARGLCRKDFWEAA